MIETYTGHVWHTKWLQQNYFIQLTYLNVFKQYVFNNQPGNNNKLYPNKFKLYNFQHCSKMIFCVCVFYTYIFI